MAQILNKHLEFITSAARSKSYLTSNHWSGISQTIANVILDFHDRMKSLLRGWKSQRLDTEIQIVSFAGGLLEGWYRNVEGLENPGTTTFQYNPYQVEIDENEGEADADAGQVADPANDEVADPIATPLSSLEIQNVLLVIQAKLDTIAAAPKSQGSREATGGAP
ncbi:hypothetical protein BDV98DRAFT_593564 [Pterulicium gracile]|uniref:Uncharacterized protein n=1 Tax=Pterulicium gracile TaxID=1884261 RepID=A0A5C3QL20_9AGAR|nr:hypothetical protein BDV98DRAFT_593564 [Pterula gracilis]